MKKNRYAIFYKTSTEEFNFFPDGRTFKTKKWASTLLFRIKRRTAPPIGAFIKEVSPPIDDTDRLQWFISRSQLAVRNKNGGLCTLNTVANPREYIDDAIRSSV